MSIPEKLKAKHFLVVDDYESMRGLVGDELKKLGINKVTFAVSGNDAIKKINALEGNDPIQYILSDLIMEDGNGIDLVKAIRQNLNKKNLPIVMITSKAEVVYVLDAVRAGVNSYLVKPWDEAEFAKKLIDSDKD